MKKNITVSFTPEELILLCYALNRCDTDLQQSIKDSQKNLDVCLKHDDWEDCEESRDFWKFQIAQESEFRGNLQPVTEKLYDVKNALGLPSKRLSEYKGGF